MMVNFEYYNPVRVVFGPGEIKKIGKETRVYGKTALVVTYLQHDYMSALLDRIKGFLEAEEVKVVPFFKITENPTSRQVDEGVELARNEGVDVVIGIGGGSVMDAAKVIAAGVLFDRPSWDMIVTRRGQSHRSSSDESFAYNTGSHFARNIKRDELRRDHFK